MLSKWIFLLLATAVMSELSGDAAIKQNQNHHVRLTYVDANFDLSVSLKIVRSEQHSRQTRAAFKSHLKPLGFFGKLAYMGGLLFQVSAT